MSVCGRYQLNSEPTVLQTFLGGFFLSQHQPRYNIAPTQRAPVLRLESGKPVCRDLRFGLIPSWSQSPPEQPLVNARSESVFEKPSFRGSMQFQRCLVPATGFYEWEKGSGGKSPFLVRRKTQSLFHFAGIWATWQAPGQRIESFAILTRSAGPRLSEIHHRVPISVEPDFWEAWLSPNTSKFAIESFLGQADEDRWDAEPVSQRVNSVRNDDPQCEQPRAVQQSLF